MKLEEPTYKLLYDKSGKKRATICLIEIDHPWATRAIGMAFCSDDDKWDDKIGERIAYARAMRAIKDRPACVARTWRIAKYILNLKYASLAYLMKLTGYTTKYFDKGMIE